MQRLPNPPKVPCVCIAQTRSPRGCKARGRLFAGVIVGALLVLAAPAGLADEVPAAGPSSDLCPAADRCPDSNIVVIGVAPARCLAIREHAEKMRRRAFETLLSDTDPAPWTMRCEIHVHATADAFADAVGGPPIDARGATSLEFVGDRVMLRRIDVMGDGPDDIPDALDHELVHVVLADHFVHAPPPRWADEGLAILFDAPAKQGEYATDFQEAARRGLAWSASDLVSLEDYPGDGGRQRVFYGQSAALVRWLVARRDAATFIRFLDDADVDGIESALRRHYALDSLASVSPAWKEVAPISSLGSSDRRAGRLP